MRHQSKPARTKQNLAWGSTLILFYLGLLSPAIASEDLEQITKKLHDLDQRLTRLEQTQVPATGVNTSVRPAPTTEETQSPEIQELRRQVELLAAEVEKLRSAEPETEVKEQTAKALGLGTSAASIYRKTRGVSIAGYGEMTYENFDNKNQAGDAVRRGTQLDLLRGVLYTGYRFSDRFIFNSEIEFEHASTGRSGEASLEFAYLDYLANSHLTLRGGLLLLPMGLTNEFHEPNAFLGVRRSETESHIIPSTWRENGVGVLGSAGMFQYRAYLVNGLDAGGFSSEGLRGGRQKGARAKASDMAFVGRLDVSPTPGVFVGGSFYTGGSGQDQFSADGRNLNANTTIGEVHAQLQIRGLDLRGLYARAALDDVAELNRARGLTGRAAVGETMRGGYLQAGYNILAPFRETTALLPFYRFEKLNTQAEISAGFLADPVRNRRFHTFGLEFRPIPHITVKTDYQWVRNRARSGVNQFNIGLGYAF